MLMFKSRSCVFNAPLALLIGLRVDSPKPVTYKGNSPGAGPGARACVSSHGRPEEARRCSRPVAILFVGSRRRLCENMAILSGYASSLDLLTPLEVLYPHQAAARHNRRTRKTLRETVRPIRGRHTMPLCHTQSPGWSPCPSAQFTARNWAIVVVIPNDASIFQAIPCGRLSVACLSHVAPCRRPNDRRVARPRTDNAPRSSRTRPVAPHLRRALFASFPTSPF